MVVQIARIAIHEWRHYRGQHQYRCRRWSSSEPKAKSMFSSKLVIDVIGESRKLMTSTPRCPFPIQNSSGLSSQPLHRFSSAHPSTRRWSSTLYIQRCRNSLLCQKVAGKSGGSKASSSKCDKELVSGSTIKKCKDWKGIYPNSYGNPYLPH